MSDALKIQDKTVLLTGAASNIGTSIAFYLAELGANISMIDEDLNKLQRIANSIMDQREISDKKGRAVAVPIKYEDEKSVLEAFHKTTETFGSVDILIDAFTEPMSCSFQDTEFLSKFDLYQKRNLRASLQLTQMVLKFFVARKRGKVIYMIPDYATQSIANEGLASLGRSSLMNFAKTLAAELSKDQVNINCVQYSLSEEYVMHKDPKASSVKMAGESLQKTLPHLHLVDSKELAQFVAFLASPLSSAVSGQVLRASK